MRLLHFQTLAPFAMSNALLVTSILLSFTQCLSDAFIMNATEFDESNHTRRGNNSYRTCYECSNYAVGQDTNYAACFKESMSTCVGMYCFNALDNLDHYPFRYFSGCLNLTEPIDIGPGYGVCYKDAEMTKCVCITDKCNSIQGGRGLYCTNSDFLPDLIFNLEKKVVSQTNDSRSYFSTIIPDYKSTTNGARAVVDITSICEDAFPTTRTTGTVQKDDQPTTKQTQVQDDQPTTKQTQLQDQTVPTTPDNSVESSLRINAPIVIVLLCLRALINS